MRRYSARRMGLSLLALIGSLCFLLEGVVYGSNFIPLDTLPLGAEMSGASLVSGDGNVVVGGNTTAIPGHTVAVRWAGPGFAIEPLTDPGVDEGVRRVATGVSLNGEVITGYAEVVDPNAPRQIQAFRWTQATSYELLPLPPGANVAVQLGLSNDGTRSVVNTDLGDAFLWTNGVGLEPLSALSTDFGVPVEAVAMDLSAEGTVVTGWSTSGSTEQAFRWTRETGTVGIGELPGGSTSSRANAISADGSTIVGHSQSALSPGTGEAFRWQEGTGMVGLGVLNAGDIGSRSEFVSADGRLVFGFSISLSFPAFPTLHSFVWSAEQGMHDFTEVLDQDYGLGTALAGWTNIYPRDISDDSLTIVGSGINPNGRQQAWLVRLDRPIGVPEPNALTLLLLAGATPMITCRRGRIA